MKNFKQSAQMVRGIIHQHLFIKLFLYLHCVLLLLFALTQDSFSQLMKGLLLIIAHPLITDYFELAGIGATFLNSFLVTAIYLLIIFKKKVTIDFTFLATIFTITGFSFFGKNLFNTLPIILGNHLYMAVSKKNCPTTINMTIFSSAVAPIVSYVAFGLQLPLLPRFIAGISLGIFLGFLFPMISDHVQIFHKGLNLFNGGFAAGILSMIVYGILNLFDIAPHNPPSFSSMYDTTAITFYLFFFLSFLMIPIITIFLQKKSQNNFLSPKVQQVQNTLIQVVILAIFYLLYLRIINASINGVILGSLLTALGFCFLGIQFKDVLNPFIGVVILQMLAENIVISQPEMISVAIFSIGLTPLSKRYGGKIGLLSGMLLIILVPLTAALHGGLNLYNSGFACGFVAATIVSLCEKKSNPFKENVI